MTPLLALAARLGVPSRLRGVAVALAAVLLLAGLIGGLLWLTRDWVRGREEQAVQVDRREVETEALSRVLEAEREAAANEAARVEVFQKSREEARREADKVAVDDPVGPGVRKYLQRVRREQTARDGHDAAR